MDVLLMILVVLLYSYLLILPFIGLIQVLGFFARLFKWSEMSVRDQKSLTIYGISVLTYFIIILIYNLIDFQIDNDGPLFLIYFLGIPNFMAIYYWTSIYKKYEDA